MCCAVFKWLCSTEVPIINIDDSDDEIPVKSTKRRTISETEPESDFEPVEKQLASSSDESFEVTIYSTKSKTVLEDLASDGESETSPIISKVNSMKKDTVPKIVENVSRIEKGPVKSPEPETNVKAGFDFESHFV